MGAIRAHRVELSAGSLEILRGVDVEVRAGEVVALLGPNGAGKSTLLKVLTRDLRPSSGEVTYDGRALASFSARELARCRAVLPQHSTLSFPLTVERVVGLGRAPFDIDPKRDRAVVDAALSLARIEALRGRAYDVLSGGERQRVQLARVLAQLLPLEPGARRWLFLDEPTASLDPSRAVDVLSLSRELASRGVGVCVVLHDVNLAARYADRVVVMNGGVVVEAGPPKDVFTRELFASAYGVDVEVLRDEDLGHPIVVPLSAGGEQAFSRVLEELSTSP